MQKNIQMLIQNWLQPIVKVVGALLRYLYNDAVLFSDVTIDLMTIADKYDLKALFNRCDFYIAQALRSWQDNNSVPEKEIVKIRQKTLEKLGMINKQLARLNLPMIEGQQALARMFNHEKEAAIKVKKEKKHTAKKLSHS